MAEVQIVSSAKTTGAIGYTVPESGEFTLKAVYCEFRDAGVAFDWTPVVEIVSDSGHTIALAIDHSVLITAGDDADASFFPGVKGGAGAAVSGRFPFLILTGILQAVPDPAVGDSDHGKFDASKKFTNAAAEWDYTLDGAGRIKEVLVDGPGLYDVTCSYEWQVNAIVGSRDCLINVIPSVVETFNGVTLTGVSPDDSVKTVDTLAGTVRAVFPITHTGSVINVQPTHQGGGNINFNPRLLSIIKFPLSPT